MFRLFLFDMDGVLLRNRSSWKYCQGAIGCDPERFYDEFQGDVLKGRDLTQLVMQKMYDHGFKQGLLEDLARKAPQFKGVGQVLEMVQARGAAAVIVSGGLGALARELAMQYPITRYVCNEVSFQDETSAPTCEIRVGHHDKGRIAKEVQAALGVTKEETVAVGDSSNDCLMFAEAGLSIAFNGDPDAKRCADHTIDSDDLSDILPIILMHDAFYSDITQKI